MGSNVLEVEIIPEDFRDAPNGFRAGTGKRGCVLQQALMRMFPDTYVQVSSHKLSIGTPPNQRSYNINVIEDWGGMSSRYPADEINRLSRLAKESLEGIPTVSLTLGTF